MADQLNVLLDLLAPDPVQQDAEPGQIPPEESKPKAEPAQHLVPWTR